MAANVNRSSFSRIDDDLSGLVLSYLPFEERIGLEETSHQFKRSVYRTQRTLSIDLSTIGGNCLNKLAKPHEFTSLRGHKLKIMNLEGLRSVLQKCPLITRIQFLNIEFVNKKEVMDTIVKYATGLVEFRMDNIVCNSEHTFEGFVNKFGPTLRSIDMPFCPTDTQRHVFEWFPNINKFKCFLQNLSLIFESNNILVKSVSEIKFFFRNEDIGLFRLFVAKNSLSLKYLSVVFNNFDDKVIKQFIPQLVRLKELRRIDIRLDQLRGESAPLFERLLKQLAINCQNLIEIKIELIPETIDGYLKVIESLNNFSQVHRIVVSIGLVMFDYEAIQGMLVSSNVLKNCKHLTELTLYNCYLNESFFEDIGTHLPRLKSININQLHRITDQTLTQLTKLSKIETIRLVTASAPHLSLASINQLYSRCDRIKTFNIIHKTLFVSTEYYFGLL